MNILYIHTHDTGKVISPYGYNTPTPNMMCFAKEALKFNKAFCASPTCSPSRAALLSGMYPHQVGMLGLSQRGFEMDMSKHLVTYLKAQGFYTVLSGIQHEASWYLDHEKGAKMIGYDENLTTSIAGYKEEDFVLWDEKNALSAARWIHHHDGKQPFFLSYGMYATHRKYPSTIAKGIDPNYVKVPDNIMDNENTRLDYARYLTSLQWADENFGKVIQALKQKGIYEETIIIFTTDHGLANPYAKCNLNDQGTGVLLMIRDPKGRHNGQVTDALTSHVDIFPTLCDILQMEKPTNLQGESMIEVLRGDQDNYREYVFEEINFHTSYEPCRAVRSKQYRYVVYYDDYLGMNLSNIDASLTKDEYLSAGIKDKKKYREALYDLRFDPLEKRNVIEDEAYKKIAIAMKKALHNHMEQTNDYMLEGLIAIDPQWKVNKKECIEARNASDDEFVSLGR